MSLKFDEMAYFFILIEKFYLLDNLCLMMIRGGNIKSIKDGGENVKKKEGFSYLQKEFPPLMLEYNFHATSLYSCIDQ